MLGIFPQPKTRHICDGITALILQNECSIRNRLVEILILDAFKMGPEPLTDPPSPQHGLLRHAHPIDIGLKMHETAPLTRFNAQPPRFPYPGIAITKMDIGRSGIKMRAKAGICMNAPAHPVARFEHHTSSPQTKRCAGCRNSRSPRANNSQIDISRLVHGVSSSAIGFLGGLRTRLRVCGLSRGPSTSRTTMPRQVRTSCSFSAMR